MKHLKLFEEFGAGSEMKQWAKLASYLARRDFEIYDGYDDLKKKFYDVVGNDSLSVEEKSTEITNYLDEKWGLYGGYEEVQQEIVSILSNTSESINEGLISITLGVMAALSIIRFIFKVVRGIKRYKTLANTLLGMTRFNATVGFGVKNLETGKVDKHEALEVIEYDDRYFLRFKGVNEWVMDTYRPSSHGDVEDFRPSAVIKKRSFKGEIDNIRVLKNERMLLIDQDGKMIKVPLTPAHYDEFISIIKHKLK